MTGNHRPWWREPAVHFLLLGVILFGLERAFFPADDDLAVITVDAHLRDELTQIFARSRGRPPNDQELQQIVDDWLESELLYREGLTLGLDRNDPSVRSWVVQKMRFVINNTVSAPEASEEDLRAWFAQHRDNYRRPIRYHLTQVATEGRGADARAAAEKMKTRLESGLIPASLGDDYRSFQGRSEDNLEAMFGSAFVAALSQQSIGQWRVLRSSQGWCVVRLDAMENQQPPTFEAVRAEVEADWRRAQQRRHVQHVFQELRQRYDIREEEV